MYFELSKMAITILQKKNNNNNKIFILFYLSNKIWKLYDLDGKDYVEEDSLTLVIDALNEFKSENPSFIGGKYIYAPIKVGTKETIATYFEVMCRLYKKFPNFLAGFDLVGQEDLSPPLTTFAEQILQLPDDIKFFFHAGETNWYGSIDENLVCLLSDLRPILIIVLFFFFK